MKKLTIYILVFVLLLDIVSAAEIFNGEVKDNVPFVVKGIEHVARYYPSAKKVSMLAGDDRILIELEDCQTIGKMTYCIDTATAGVDEDTGDPKSVMEIRILESGPELSVSRSISEDEPGLGEEVEVTATITNSGNERASNVNFEDRFPSGVKVSSAAYNFGINGVLWTGSLNEGDSATVKYKLTFEDFVDFNSTAKATYVYDNKLVNEYSSEVLFSVQKPFTVNDYISQRSVDLNEKIEYHIYINNTDGADDLKVTKVEARIPEGMKPTNRGLDWEISGNKLSYSGTVSPGEDKDLYFSLTSSKKAQDTLTTTVNLRYGSKDFEESFSHKLGIGVSAIMPQIEFSKEEVKGGREIEIDARVINEGESTIDEISIDMSSDIVENKGWRHIELDPGKSYVAFNKIINAPSVDEEKEFYVTLSGSYLSPSGKTMKYSSTEKVTVLPPEKVIEMTPDFKVRDKEVDVTLNIKSIAANPLSSVSLIDMLPKGFTMTDGQRDKDIKSLAAGEELEAYKYTVKIPATYTADTFEITHIFNGYDESDESLMFELKSEVNLTGASTADKSEDDSADVNESSDTNSTKEDTVSSEGAVDKENEEKKPGVFKRMWNWIASLFKGDDEKFE